MSGGRPQTSCRLIWADGCRASNGSFRGYARQPRVRPSRRALQCASEIRHSKPESDQRHAPMRYLRGKLTRSGRLWMMKRIPLPRPPRPSARRSPSAFPKSKCSLSGTSSYAREIIDEEGFKAASAELVTEKTALKHEEFRIQKTGS